MTKINLMGKTAVRVPNMDKTLWNKFLTLCRMKRTTGANAIREHIAGTVAQAEENGVNLDLYRRQ
jgi:hypothetical protein